MKPCIPLFHGTTYIPVTRCGGKQVWINNAGVGAVGTIWESPRTGANSCYNVSGMHQKIKDLIISPPYR